MSPEKADIFLARLETFQDMTEVKEARTLAEIVADIVVAIKEQKVIGFNEKKK